MSYDVFTIHSVGFGATGTQYLRQIDNVSANAGLQELVQGGGGIDTLFAGTIQGDSSLTFDTPALAELLDIVPFAGLSSDEVAVWFAKYAAGGTLAGAGNHLKLALDNCSCYLQRINAQQGQEAIASVEVVSTSDDASAPYSQSTGQTLPSLTQTIEKFTVGPVYLNGTRIETQSIEFDAGLELLRSRASGNHWTEFVAIQSREPGFTVNTLSIPNLSDVGVSGSGKADVDVYFRRLTNKGQPVADATATHIKLTATEAFVMPQPISGSTRQPAAFSFMVRPVWDQVNDIVQIDTASAIA